MSRLISCDACGDQVTGSDTTVAPVGWMAVTYNPGEGEPYRYGHFCESCWRSENIGRRIDKMAEGVPK